MLKDENGAFIVAGVLATLPALIFNYQSLFLKEHP